MTSNRKQWVFSPPSATKPKVPDAIKLILKEKAGTIIENTIKPNYILPLPTDNDFNYLVDIYTKWYRNYFYFCATYNSPSPNAIAPSFEIKWARMEYVGHDKFNLSYLRHTGKWAEVLQDLSMADSLNAIINESYFEP